MSDPTLTDAEQEALHTATLCDCDDLLHCRTLTPTYREVERIVAARVAEAVEQAEVERQAEEDRANQNVTLVHEERAARLALVARIEALAGSWERDARHPNGHSLLIQAYAGHARKLRVLLSADDTEERAQ